MATPLLEARGISKYFGAITALTDVNFHVDEGEVLGVVGDNGAGKSTLMKILSGLFTPSEGQLLFRGKPVRFHSPKDAQRLGYAEADPTFDVEGFDTAHKLAILTALAFGTEVDAGAIHIEGISSITPADIEAADELGYRIKLLGVASRTETGIEQRVHPTMVPKSSAIARIDGVLNAVAVDADAVGEIVLVGPGAGGAATASSVVGDIADVAAGRSLPAFGRKANRLVPYRPAQMRAHAGGYYVRLLVRDRPGAFATVAAHMGEHGISLESIVQRRRAPKADAPGSAVPSDTQPIMMITYETTEAAMRDALKAVAASEVVAGVPRMIRIEKLA